MIKRFFQAISDFFKDVKSELSKVTFPSKSETIGSTTVVIVFTLIVSFFLAVVDLILVRLLRLVV
ncbi:MAG: preprotein translocase subunit SecE [Candidatus Manganitrophaceae bacterium]|nr:MAG: preprotein translocase subunit SecE [Candidatus Manganitrophaceae bacterium]